MLSNVNKQDARYTMQYAKYKMDVTFVYHAS